MSPLKPSLFSFRTLFLIVVALCAARSTAAIVSPPGTLPGDLPSGPQSSIFDDGDFTVLENFQPALGGGTGLDAILIPSSEDFVSEVLGDQEFFILSSGSEVNARSWLAYLAPPNVSLQLTIQSSSNFLQSLASFATVPLDTPSPPPAITPPFVPNEPLEEASEFVVFLGIDLSENESSPLEVNLPANDDLTLFTFSDFIEPAASVPEPSSALLAFLALGGAFLKRNCR